MLTHTDTSRCVFISPIYHASVGTKSEHSERSDADLLSLRMISLPAGRSSRPAVKSLFPTCRVDRAPHRWVSVENTSMRGRGCLAASCSPGEYMLSQGAAILVTRRHTFRKSMLFLLLLTLMLRTCIALMAIFDLL